MAMSLRAHAGEIFHAGLRAVEPDVCMKTHLQITGHILKVGERVYNLGGYKNIYAIGFGKAGGEDFWRYCKGYPCIRESCQTACLHHCRGRNNRYNAKAWLGREESGIRPGRRPGNGRISEYRNPQRRY